MLIRAIDLETSGEEPNIDIIEVGWTSLIPVYKNDDKPAFWDMGPTKSLLANPGGLVTPESSGVHHIIEEDLIGADTPEEAIELMADGPCDMILAAHFADYEMGLLGSRGFRRIDTWKVAVHLAPNAPNWKLQTLRYWLKLDVDRARAAPAHRAGPDSYVCAALLNRMLTKISPQKMVEISSGPIFLPRFGFGKHKNLPIAEIPTSYLEWMLNQNDKNPEERFDENVTFTATSEIKRRQREGNPT